VSRSALSTQSGMLICAPPYLPNASVGRDIYIGRFYDDAPALIYLNARYYDPSRGQFISQDPMFWSKSPNLANPQSLNSYLYANGNPINLSDPDGLSATTALQGYLTQLFQLLTAISVELAKMSVQGPSSAVPSVQQASSIFQTARNPEPVVNGVKTYVRDTYNAMTTIGRSDEGDYLLGERAADATLLFLGGRGVSGTGSRIPQVMKNQLRGNAFRDDVARTMQNAGFDVQKEVRKSTFFGPRVIDIEVSKNGETRGGIEAKTGNSPYSPMQRAKDAWLNMFDGYIVNVIRDNL
jgi:RHS repeat-associated protein